MGGLANANSMICTSHVHPAGVATIMMFTFMSYYLYKCIQLPHEQAFKNRYAMRYQQVESFGGLLETSPISEQAASSKSGKSPRELAPRFPGAHGNCVTM